VESGVGAVVVPPFPLFPFLFVFFGLVSKEVGGASVDGGLGSNTDGMKNLD
jgi:hypothetical protein